MKRIACIALILITLWQPQLVAQDYNPLREGTVSVTVKKGNITVHKTYSQADKPVKKPKRYAQNQVLSTQTISIDIKTDMTSCRGSNGSINATASGGTPPYKYSFDGDGPFDNGYYPRINAGNHLVEVTDAAGNTATATAIVSNTDEPPLITITSFNHPTLCDRADGGFVVSASGGQPPYEFTLDNVSFRTSGTFTNLPSGFYTIMVRDAKGCGSYAFINLITPYGCGIPFGLSFSSAFCQVEGKVKVTYYGSNGPYESSLNGSPYSPTLEYTDLAPGEYTFDVRSATGEKTKFMFHVVKLCYPRTNVQVVDNSCDNDDGRAILTTDNGTPPYRYSIDGVNFQTSNEFNGLKAGRYNIGVIDDEGIIMRIEADVNGGCFDVAETHTNIVCGNANGKIEITASGGKEPYTYRINNSNFQASNKFEGLDPGVHTVIVQDADGKRKQIAVEITNTPGFTSINAQSPPACAGAAVKLIVLSGGGTSPLRYSLNDIDYQSNPEFDIVAGQNYTVYAIDANGCKISAGYQSPVACFSVTVNAFNSSCGNNNGRLHVNADDGVEPYSYSIDGITFQTSNTFDDLAPGMYEVVVRDANNVVRNTPSEIKSSCAELTLNVINSTCDAANGRIEATGSNGQLPYQFSIDGSSFVDQPIFENLIAGTYTIYLKDASGYIVQQQASLLTDNNLSFDISDDMFVCEGVPVVLSITNPKSNYRYLWSIENGSAIGVSPTLSVIPDKTTSYDLKVTDGLCSASKTVNVTVFPAPVANAGEDITVCSGQNAQLNGSGGATFMWSPSIYLSDATNAKAHVLKPDATQDYSLTVTDARGCKSLHADTVKVFVTPPEKLYAGKDTILMNGTSFQLDAQDINNSGFTSYSWAPAFGLSDPAIKNPVAMLQSDITYTVTAQTEAGCKSEGSIKLKVYAGPGIYVPNAFTPNRDGLNDEFKVVAVGIKTFKYVAIYNRWGQMVYYSTDPSSGWNGFVSSKEADNGTYVWKAEGIDINGHLISKRGVVVLVR